MKENWVYRRGDIYLANLGVPIGSKQGGVRPVVVLQNDVGNFYSPTITVAPLTTKIQKKRSQPTHYFLRKAKGLARSSMVLAEQLDTCDKTCVIRYLGKVPTVIDRTLQQAITQQLVPIYEPLFAEGSYGYRPNRSAKDAILKVKKYAEQGYTFAVVLDLSKYFDTLNHEILINLLRKNVKDERVVQLIKRYLKSGVMENGVVIDTEEGSPQGGNLSPLLANVYLNEFDQEFLKRGVPCIRYADDIVLLAKSKRASERLLESSTKYLEERLKLTVNREKSRTVSVFAIRNFKFLGFALGRNGKGIYVRVHPKSWKKFKSRLKELSSRKRCQSIKPSLEKIKVYARGWLNYYGIASMKNNIDDINGWLYHRIRMCIWKQWKLPRTKKRNLIKMGIHEYYANMAANCRRGHWYCANLTTVKKAMTKERLINSGFYDLATAYQSVHVNY
ncbi:group II intron reverse transcriptase/maturase [Flavonifractor plautii]|uniref:group II intron reverse transcriptase/maturase n=1 Tax=Flavonifractor plautii TaxID=292800 RepID=UPI00189D6434|nr:group II intron reverse transcriptase/maturase [Flavonifractor plautii]